MALVVDNQFEIPAFQFTSIGGIFRVAGEVNRSLGAARHPLATASWWLSRDGRLGGQRPFRLLNEPEEERLVELAQASLELIA